MGKMGKRPNLNALDCFLDAGTDFQITDSIYESKTGVPLPKDKSYVLHKSALSEWAKEHGYIVFDVEEKPVIQRTVFLKKRCEK